MDQISLLGLPSEIIEHICSYLSLFDVAKLEQTNKKMLQTIQGVRVWKRVAERFGRKFNYPLVRALLKHMKENDITDVKYYKIVIGITAHSKKIVGDLERAANQYKSDGEQEMEKYQEERNRAHLTSKQFNLWLRRMVKLFIQEDLMRAKVKQILTFNTELILTDEDEILEEQVVDKEKIVDFFEDESPDVVLHIKRFEDWIRRLYRPTDDEVRQCAQTRSPHFLDTIRQILIENHLPQN